MEIHTQHLTSVRISRLIDECRTLARLHGQLYWNRPITLVTSSLDEVDRGDIRHDENFIGGLCAFQDDGATAQIWIRDNLGELFSVPYLVHEVAHAIIGGISEHGYRWRRLFVLLLSHVVGEDDGSLIRSLDSIILEYAKRPSDARPAAARERGLHLQAVHRFDPSSALRDGMTVPYQGVPFCLKQEPASPQALLVAETRLHQPLQAKTSVYGFIA